MRIIRFGSRAHSAIERAIGARAGDPDWGERLGEALADFPGCTWPLEQLTRRPKESL